KAKCEMGKKRGGVRHKTSPNDGLVLRRGCLLFFLLSRERKKKQKRKQSVRRAKGGASNTNSGQTATAVCGGRFFGDGTFFINRKRCPRFTDTVCAEGRLFLFPASAFLCFFLFSEKKEEKNPKPSPLFGLGFLLTLPFSFSRLGFSFASFLFSEKKRSRKKRPSDARFLTGEGVCGII
ncbi:MAG: hypothetical protein IJF24_05115, partial [Clostridia bacterium]|nr:hypothetical protein [Clostridia bacterium]